MAKRKSKHDNFIAMCEKNQKLYTLATTSSPSCNLYDVEITGDTDTETTDEDVTVNA